MLLVNEKLYSRDGEPGFHVYLIGSEVAVYDQLKTTVRSEFFRADDVGAVGFERFIEGLPAGQIVAPLVGGQLWEAARKRLARESDHRRVAAAINAGAIDQPIGAHSINPILRAMSSIAR